MNEIHKCPHCGESYYAEKYSVTTCLAWMPVYKNGVLINEDPNTTTTYCDCLNCGESFSYATKGKHSSPMQASLDCIVPGPDADPSSMSILR